MQGWPRSATCDEGSEDAGTESPVVSVRACEFRESPRWRHLELMAGGAMALGKRQSLLRALVGQLLGTRANNANTCAKGAVPRRRVRVLFAQTRYLVTNRGRSGKRCLVSVRSAEAGKSSCATPGYHSKRPSVWLGWPLPSSPGSPQPSRKRVRAQREPETWQHSTALARPFDHAVRCRDRIE